VILVCINDENRAKLDLLMEQVFPGMRLGSFVWRTTAVRSRTEQIQLVIAHDVLGTVGLLENY